MSSPINKSEHQHKRHLLHSAGILPTKSTLEDTIHLSIPQLFLHRIPWIIIGLIGAFLSVFIIESFGNTLEKNIVLVAFIPLIVYISAAVGTQTQTLFVRDLAIQRHLSLLKYTFKQLLTTALIALVCSIIVFIGAYVFQTPIHIIWVISLSTFITINTSTLVALLIPYFLNSYHQDPAIGSGPFATTIQDVLTIFIYFLIISLFL